MNLSLLASSTQMFHTNTENHPAKIPLLFGKMKSVKSSKMSKGKRWKLFYTQNMGCNTTN